MLVYLCVIYTLLKISQKREYGLTNGISRSTNNKSTSLVLHYCYTNVNNEPAERKHEQHNVPFLNNSLCTWDTYATRGVPEKKGKKKKKGEERNNTRFTERRGNDTRHAIARIASDPQRRIN